MIAYLLYSVLDLPIGSLINLINLSCVNEWKFPAPSRPHITTKKFPPETLMLLLPYRNFFEFVNTSIRLIAWERQNVLHAPPTLLK